MLLADYGSGLGYIQMPKIQNLEIPIPPLNIQEQIIHKIAQLNDQSSHYNVYAQILQKEIDMISDTIKNMTNCDSSKDDIMSEDDNMSTTSQISIIHENLGIDHNLLTFNLGELNVIQKKMTKVNKKSSKPVDDNIDDVIEI